MPHLILGLKHPSYVTSTLNVQPTLLASIERKYIPASCCSLRPNQFIMVQALKVVPCSLPCSDVILPG